MRDAMVLCYHGVSEEWPSDLAVRPGDLEVHVDHFLAAGYRPVTFTEAVTGDANERVMAVTFDDAYRSLIEVAHPVLAHKGVPGTVFAPTAFVGEEGPHGWDGTSQWAETEWASEIHVMDWDQLGFLASQGWEVGSHTRTHPHLPELEDEELEAELSESRAQVERAMGGRCTSIAYPYGECDARVGRAAAAAGYAAGGGLLPDRLSHRDPHLFPRVFAGRHTPRPVLYRRAGPFHRRLQGSAGWPAIARLASLRGRLTRSR